MTLNRWILIRNIFFILLIVVLLLIYSEFTNKNNLTGYQKEQKYFFKSLNYDKFIVITSINNPTNQVETLSKQNGFKLIVVADLKKNQSWSFNNSIFLSIDNQTNIHLKRI